MGIAGALYILSFPILHDCWQAGEKENESDTLPALGDLTAVTQETLQVHCPSAFLEQLQNEGRKN